MKTSAGPKLPSDQPYALPMNSPVEFEVKFKDPFNLVASISTDWKFGHDDPPVTKWQNTTIYHTFHKEGKYFLWVTIRVNTKFLGTKSFHPIGKTLYVKGWYMHFLFFMLFSNFCDNCQQAIDLNKEARMAIIWPARADSCRVVAKISNRWDYADGRWVLRVILKRKS